MFATFSEYIFLILSFKFIKKDKCQILFISILTILYITVLSIYKESYWFDTIFSIKIKLNNFIFEYLGKRLFWIYILQRIPMIIFKDMFNYQI